MFFQDADTPLIHPRQFIVLYLKNIPKNRLTNAVLLSILYKDFETGFKTIVLRMVISLVRINDIARLANVSPATVSRVINGTVKVREDKKRRVLEAIQETGYSPNEIARSLFKKSSHIIGYIVPNILNMFLNEIGRSIETEAFRNGYKVIVCNTDESPEKEAAYINMLTSMNADGMIITTNNELLQEELQNCSLPIVALDQKEGESCTNACVQADNFTGGYLAAEHLIRCGCRHIVQMRGPQKYYSGIQRFQGYRTACEKFGIEPLYIDSNYDFNDGILCSRELLRRFPKTDGILTASDMTALSLYKVLCEQGRRVPDDMMIVGFDNVELSTLMTPELTTIAQPMVEIGKTAVNIIIKLVEGKPVEKQVNILPVFLKKRQTTFYRS